ncbi:MAG TPA: choice-of-anchor X domain-containing protein [Kofleriaceae bacterium]|nr:choice-of-anchor X domain-containing protein [Kofleriaceae bacterium]
MTGRRIAVAALAVIAALVLLVYLLRPGRGDAPAQARSVEPAVLPVAASVHEPAEGELPPVPADQVAPLIPESPPPVALPPDTQQLTEEFVPGTTEWEEVPLGEGRREQIRFVPARYNVIAPQPIVLYLEVVDPATGKRIDAALPRARIKPFAAGDDAWIEGAMRDDGRGGDEVAGDHRYTASFAPDGKLLGRVQAEAIVQLAGAGTRRVPQALIYTAGPRAHLTGRWRDEARDGHLVLAAEVAVEAEGMFALMAQLVGPARQPIALVRAMETLPAGTHWMTLRVWGKAIHDAEIDGPYEVRNVLLRRDVPERGDYEPGPTVLSAHHTRPYRAAEFSDAAYSEPTARGEDIGPTHPSQRNNPPPLHPDSERPSRRGIGR